MNRLRMRAEGGFTLIELLVVIAIIGILAAIAIPQFAAYRRRSFEAQVKSDLHNAAVAQEAYFVSGNTYKLCGTCDGNVLTGYNRTTTLTIASGGGGHTFRLSAEES